MKKIVALVLSLVMVLGLATVAFAATTYTYENKALTVSVADGSTVDVSAQGDVVKTDAVVNTTTVNGVTTTTKVPAFYTFANVAGEYYYECDKSVADYLFAIKGVGSVYVMKTTAPIAAINTADVATAYTAPLKPTCDKVGSGLATYLVIDGKYYSTTVTNGAKYAFLNGNMVVCDNQAATAQTHQLALADAKTFDAATGLVTSIECSVCEKPVAVYTKAGSFDGKEYVDTQLAWTLGNTNGTYFYVKGAAAVAPSVDAGDKVESAETFDAGIAMYVGMSVMAAAGSAVVLKKKD